MHEAIPKSLPSVMLAIIFDQALGARRPIEAVFDEETVEVPISLRTRRPCYVLRVKGDSMVEEGIFDRYQIIVEHREEARNGEIVVALIDGHETTLKRIEQRRGGIILLRTPPMCRWNLHLIASVSKVSLSD